MVTVTTRVVVGADIGQKTDPTAIVVAEHQRRGDVTHYPIRLIERLPLGTAYPNVADRIAEIIRNLELRSQSYEPVDRQFSVELMVDATGIGLAVVDLLVERGLRATGCYFTSGDKRVEKSDNTITIGKGWLVGRLQVLLQASRIHLPQSAETNALVTELQNYEIRVNEKANMQTGAFRTGTHDDLVTALGLAVGIDRGASTALDSSAFMPVDPRHLRYQRSLRRGGHAS